MFFRRPPVLSPEELEKEALKLDLHNRILECRKLFESINILITNDLEQCAFLLIDHFLIEVGNALLTMIGTPTTTDLNQILTSLDRSSNSKTFGKALDRYINLVTQFLKTTENPSQKAIDLILKESIQPDILGMLERTFRQLKKRELATSLNSLNVRRTRNTAILCLLATVSVIIVLLMRSQYGVTSSSFWNTQYVLGKATPTMQRLEDLTSLRDAIERYQADTGAYPGTNLQWTGLAVCDGKARPDWIPGLVPKYLKQLPRDPRASNNCNQQYLYRSDGRNFKLIAHDPDDFPQVKAKWPKMVDPGPRGPPAYGYWTPGAEDF